MSRLTNPRSITFALLVALLLTLPILSFAATFSNPLIGTTDIRTIIENLIWWLVDLAAIIALLALVVGGIRLIIGGFNNEQEAMQAKKIITWAIIGLTVVGLAAAILWAIATIIGI